MLPAHFQTAYDFIFTGTGCGSLSLLMRMIRSGKFSDKKILLIDKAPKVANDRTWCFWEKENGFFEEIVYHQWENLDFYSNSWSGPLQIKPYHYKMIRGIDFYNYCFNKIREQPNIDIQFAEVRKIVSGINGVIIDIDNVPLNAGTAIVFNSIYNPSERKKGVIYLLQHFKGWMVETEQASFNPQKGILMDFRVHQQQGTSFAYTLPLSETQALVEYTLFTEKLLNKSRYDEELRNYLHDFLKISEYEVREEEFGVIPMTNDTFNFYSEGVYHLGTAGGQTKASSGYTFQFIQKQSQHIADCLTNGKSLQSVPPPLKRFQFYDTVLLRILAEGKLPGSEIFSRLFQRNQAAAVFKFLDNETSPAEELKIISTLPVIPFLKSAMKR